VRPCLPLPIVLCFFFLFLACETNQKIVHIGIHKDCIVYIVSPEGNDHWSGTLVEPNRDRSDGPFATVARAQSQLREIKQHGEFDRPVTVYLRGGRYLLREPIVFTPEDSGTEKFYITYANFPGEEPVLSGGKVLKEWGTMEGRNWALVKNADNRPMVTNQLFVDGERRQRAKTPNEGYYQTVGMISTDPKATFTYREGDINKEWAETGNVEVCSLAKWSSFRWAIHGVDDTIRSVTLAGKTHSWIRVNEQRYWIENTEECLDQPGEWFLNNHSGMLNYIPLSDENIKKRDVVVPVLEKLLLLQGEPEQGRFVEHLRFEGLTFSHTDWRLPAEGYPDYQAAFDVPAVISAVGANHCKISQCLITHIGNYGIELGKGCKDNLIIGNEITDAGAGGIRIGEPERRIQNHLLTMKNTVSDNVIHDIGHIYPGAVGIWVGQSGYNLIAHNEIYDTYYSAISLGWTWGYGLTNAHFNIVEYNHCYNLGRGLLSDMGAIYTLGMQNGTVVRNNVFHDINAYTYGGWGLYPDEGSSFIVFENNFVYRTKSAGFHQHYGKKNVIRNNIFAYGKEKQVMRTRNEDHLSFIFEQNIVLWDSGDLLGSNWQGDQYQFANNLYWNTKSGDVAFDRWTFEEWQARGLDAGSRIADPLFVDPANHDFSLQPDSPAHAMGIMPIDVQDVGPRENLKRQVLRGKLQRLD
jgi:hypothetical protein